MTESEILAYARLQATKLGGRLWRNQSGLAWQGEIISKNNNVLHLRNPRPLKSGLVIGASDLIGFLPIRITEEHLGKILAIFWANEIKTKNDKLSKEQLNFLQFIGESGGEGWETKFDGSKILIKKY
jgi:hypothetical protein